MRCHAASVSAAFNEAMAEKAYRDRRRRGLWKARGDQADPGRIARMMAHVDQQLAKLACASTDRTLTGVAL